MKRVHLFNHTRICATVALSVVTGCMTTFGASVWRDAILWYNGAVDLNNDGYWTGNDYAGTTIPRKCNGSSTGCELPDARHGALSASDTQILNYATGNGDVYNNSRFGIRTNDVHFTAWGNKTVKWPCLYLPQAPSGKKYPYSQMFVMNNGGKLITSDQWTILFRCRIDGFGVAGGNSWIWKTETDTSKGGEKKEIRIGFGRNINNSSDTKSYVKLSLGNSQPAFTDLCVQTNEWIEVAVTVDGRAESHSVRASLACTNNVRWYSNYTVPYSHSSYTTNFWPTLNYLGGPRWYVNGTDGAGDGNDNFRGDIQMFAMWNRMLSDREVCEAFGGGAPNRFRLGEEDCTAEMYGGAAPAAGATVTLDPLASDKRAFPTALTKGATFRIPFSVDKYAAGTAHWLRFSPQQGSSAGTIAVALDGRALDNYRVPARPSGAAMKSAYLYIKAENFTIGDHVLTLTRTDNGSGSLIYDVIELGGNWHAGIVDGSVADATSDSVVNPTYAFGTIPAPDTWHTDSLNLKEFVRYVGRDYGDRMHRAKTIVWNMPQGAAEKFGMRMSYNVLWKGETPLTNSLVTTVNGTPVHTNSDIVASETVAFDIKANSQVLMDGENTIVLDFLPVTRTDGNRDWVTPDMIAIEPLRPRSAMVIVVR